jgi:hypothetical protein
VFGSSDGPLCSGPGGSLECLGGLASFLGSSGLSPNRAISSVKFIENILLLGQGSGGLFGITRGGFLSSPSSSVLRSGSEVSQDSSSSGLSEFLVGSHGFVVGSGVRFPGGLTYKRSVECFLMGFGSGVHLGGGNTGGSGGEDSDLGEHVGL